MCIICIRTILKQFCHTHIPGMHWQEKLQRIGLNKLVNELSYALSFSINPPRPPPTTNYNSYWVTEWKKTHLVLLLLTFKASHCFSSNYSKMLTDVQERHIQYQKAHNDDSIIYNNFLYGYMYIPVWLYFSCQALDSYIGTLFSPLAD